MRNFSRNLLKKASATTANRSEDAGVAQYGNYASKSSCGRGLLAIVLTNLDTDVEATEIYGANVKRLEELKHQYDPDNLFSNGTRLVPRPLVIVN